MSNGFDLTAFIPKFADENRDRIQKVNGAILAFEKDPANLELLKEIMRGIHTLKGTARMMGFNDIVDLSHKVEDVFVKIKEKGLQTTKELYDVVFRALDTLANMVETKLKDAQTPIDIQDMCGQLEGVLSGYVDQTRNEASPPPLITEESGAAQASSAELPEQPEKSGAGTNSPQYAQPPSDTAKPNEMYKESHIPPSGVSEPEGEQKKATDEGKVIQENKKTIRIGMEKIHVLYNQLVELIMTQMAFHQRYEEMLKVNHYVKQLKKIKTEMDVYLRPQEFVNKNLHEIITRYNTMEKCLFDELSRNSGAYKGDVVKLDTVTEDIRQQVMSMRMQPVSTIFDMAPRLIRDIARQFNKEIELVISGGDVELDNIVIDMLKDPLVHLLRNAVDHGIEEPPVRISSGKKSTGVITLSAKQEGENVLVIIGDDGKGIDRERVKETAIRKGFLTTENAQILSDEQVYEFILKPGFSTSKIITDTSGRGVGLDVVKTVIDRLNGSLVIESQMGLGSRFVLKVPTTIALINVLVVRVGDTPFAIPSNSIEHIAYIYPNDVKTLEGKASVFIYNQTIPLVRMADIFMLEKEAENRNKSVPIIIARSDGKKIGFMVSEFLCEKEIVFREFAGYLKRPRYFSGVTTLGTGEIVLILHMQELINAKESGGMLSERKRAQAEKPGKHMILIAEDSMITAELERNILVNAGYMVDVANDGIDAIDKLHMKHYDLLVTDIDMPRMNGFELTAKVRSDKRLKDIPVVVVTAREKVEDKRKGIEVGADAYILKKEFDQSSLLYTIKRLIGE
ncbi:MAG TPA: hybrid sensor histidine kinase/response regulator [Candidatus Brocadiaceae bacterium]